MAVLDASAVIAFLLDEPSAPRVRALLDQPSVSYLCAVNLAEIVDVLGRRARDAQFVDRQVELLLYGGLDVVSADEVLAWHAGRLRAEHYRRRSRDIALGDCFALATAIRVGGPLVTTDRDLAEVARLERTDVLELPRRGAAAG